MSGDGAAPNPSTGPARHGRLAGKVALVTGGGSGIGLATAKRFVAEGAAVAIGDRDTAALERAAAEVGPGLLTVRADVTDEGDVEALVAATLGAHGRLDVVFANAGIGSNASIVDSDLVDWMNVVNVCLVGPFLTIKHAAPKMAPGGSIVVTTSLNAVQPGTGMSAYCAAKAGAAMLVQVAALELGPAGIRVNAVGPGLVKTALTDAMWLMPALVDDYVENTPLGRYADPSDIANLVTFLASDESAFISGSQYLIDGGAHTRRYPDLLKIVSGLMASTPPTA